MVREGNHKRQSKRIEPLSDAETRYMDVNIVQLTETDFLILGGCSDGLLRLPISFYIFLSYYFKNEVII